MYHLMEIKSLTHDDEVIEVLHINYMYPPLHLIKTTLTVLYPQIAYTPFAKVSFKQTHLYLLLTTLVTNAT